MKSLFKRSVEKPILILLAINILAGLFVFRDYGFSWDEPFFYDYADALGYAYSPGEWFSGEFDLNHSYGPSGDDHKTRGPAYLLLARAPAALLQALGLDRASAWHLINFLFFQLGIYFLYRLALRWMKPFAAFSAAVLFSWQPLLWGHAFINPKDPPFLTFFLASVCLGFEMVDTLADDTTNHQQRFFRLILAAISLGIASSIRVLGPLAGLLVVIYAMARFNKQLRRFIPPLALYGILAMLAMFVTWPFLWEDPLRNFIGVFGFMSDNPTNLSVLFAGEIHRAGELPRRYLPVMLATTLTEPVWLLFAFGIVIGYIKWVRQRKGGNTRPVRSLAVIRRKEVISLSLVLLWLVILIVYVLLRRPAMYDGMRHFLFILPPIFISTGFVFEFLVDHIASNWLRAGIIALLLLPGIAGILRLHPYEYTYYNSFVGGTNGAFRQYETDYWLTCYKDAVNNFEQALSSPATLFVHREAYIAAYYADENINVRDLHGTSSEVKPGDYVLVNTRTNEDRKVFKDAPTILQVGRGKAIFCEIKRIP